MTQEDLAQGARNVQAGVESARRMAVRFRVVVLVLTVVTLLGLILHNEITYAPAFPVVLLVDSLLCLIAGTRADWISRGFKQFGGAAGGLAYSAVVGGGIAFLFSAFGASFGPGHSGHASSWGNQALLFNLSWPTMVISLIAIVFGIRTYRRIRNLPR